MPVSQTQDTLLVIEGMGIPRWSARALTERLRMIDAAQQVVRTINGAARNWSQPQFRKYDVIITCTDHRVLKPDHIWPGAEVTIDCVTEFPRDLYAEPFHEVVEGSERQEGDFVFYRPRLQCMFVGFTPETPEWEGRVSWEANFTEI